MIVAVSRRAQRGATLIVGLIMLVLLTLVVTSAVMLSTGNLKAGGNMQFRSEAIAAANKAIEQVLGSPFTNAPSAEDINVDINNDGNTDYVVNIALPDCIRASVAAAAAASSLSLGTAMSTSSHWNTIWDIDATVNDAVSGATVRVRHGVRVLLTQSQKNAVCP
jgi:Tfp pilus assembly protein PilX